MSIYEAITDLIGQVPQGMEKIAWLVCAVILVYLITCAFGIIGSMVKFLTGGR